MEAAVEVAAEALKDYMPLRWHNGEPISDAQRAAMVRVAFEAAHLALLPEGLPDGVQLVVDSKLDLVQRMLSGDHRRSGENCGEDACGLCLAAVEVKEVRAMFARLRVADG